MFTILYEQDVVDDLRKLRTHNYKRILDSIEEQLLHQPTQPTRNRKPLPGLEPPWEHVEPIWELRVGEYRVFYDVDENAGLVNIRAVRHKPPHKTTEEIL